MFKYKNGRTQLARQSGKNNIKDQGGYATNYACTLGWYTKLFLLIECLYTYSITLIKQQSIKYSNHNAHIYDQLLLPFPLGEQCQQYNLQKATPVSVRSAVDMHFSFRQL